MRHELTELDLDLALTKEHVIAFQNDGGTEIKRITHMGDLIKVYYMGNLTYEGVNAKHAVSMYNYLGESK